MLGHRVLTVFFFEASCVHWHEVPSMWNCLQLFLLAFGMCLVGWRWHAWSGICVGYGICSQDSSWPGGVGGAAHPASFGAELHGYLISPSIAPECGEVPPSLHTACWCFTSAIGFRACAAGGTDMLCPLIAVFIKLQMSLPDTTNCRCTNQTFRAQLSFAGKGLRDFSSLMGSCGVATVGISSACSRGDTGRTVQQSSVCWRKKQCLGSGHHRCLCGLDLG